MSSLRYADEDYFRKGQFQKDLSEGSEPVLIDPAWQNTILSEILSHKKESIQIKKPNLFWVATSGSTGKPKLVQKSWEQMSEEVYFWKSHFHSSFGWDLPKNPKWIVTVPLCHLYGLIWGFLFPLQMGWNPISVKRLSELTSDEIEDSYLISTPNQIRNFHSQKKILPKHIFSSGAKFPSELARVLREEGKTNVREIYGSTETGAMGVRDPFWKSRFTILPFVETRLSQEEGGHSLEVKSKLVSETAMEFVEERWDTIRLTDEDGYFPTRDWGDFSTLGWNQIGRVDRIAKIKGKRIAMDLVESLFLSLHSVSEAAVVCFEENQNSILGCYVVLKEGKTEEEVKSEMVKSFPHSHIPDTIRFSNSLPKLANQKTDYIRIKKDLENPI